MNIRGHYMDIHVKYKSLQPSLFTYNTHIMSTNNHKFHVRGSNDQLAPHLLHPHFLPINDVDSSLRHSQLLAIEIEDSLRSLNSRNVINTSR